MNNKKKYPKELSKPIVIPRCGTCDSSASIKQAQMDVIKAEWKSRIDKICDYLLSEGNINSYSELPGFKLVAASLEELPVNDVRFYVAVLQELKTDGVDEGGAVEKVATQNSGFRKFKNKNGNPDDESEKELESLRSKFNRMKNGNGYPTFAKLKQTYINLTGSSDKADEALEVLVKFLDS